MANAILTWEYNESGKPAQIVDYPEGTSETFNKGDLVIFDRSEDGVVGLPNTGGVPTAQDFLGIAQLDASGTQGTRIPVLIPTANDVFSAAVSNNSQTAFTAPAGDDRGRLYGLILMTDGNAPYAVDINATTWVKVIDVHPQDVARRGKDYLSTLADMTAGDRLTFKFQEAVLDNAGSQA